MGFVNMNIVIIASVVFVLQSILSLMQIRYYQRYMYNITQQYSNSKNYHLYSSIERKRLGSSAIVVMVIDENKMVKECQLLKGKSIFAKFKPLPRFYGCHLSQILTNLREESETRKLSLEEKAIIKMGTNQLPV